METKVVVPALPAPEWNKNEVAEAVKSKLTEYENVVYTAETVKQAKSDRAELNKLSKAIDDERKKVKALYLAPYEAFEKDVKQIVGTIDKTTAAIDAQVKAFEAQEKATKTEAVRKIYEMHEWHGIKFETVFNPKWANATASLTAVTTELENMAQSVEADLTMLSELDEYSFEATETYKATLSLSQAMQTAKALKEAAKRKAEYEAQKNAEPKKVVVKDVENRREIKYTDDGLPDFGEAGDMRHTIIIRAKVTDDIETAIRSYLGDLAVEYEIIGGAE